MSLSLYSKRVEQQIAEVGGQTESKRMQVSELSLGDSAAERSTQPSELAGD
jgi:hypothetical protein